MAHTYTNILIHALFSNQAPDAAPTGLTHPLCSSSSHGCRRGLLDVARSAGLTSNQ